MEIIINDYREYDEKNCTTGGNYAYFTKYVKVDNNEWKVYHSTTAEFDYCSICGTFGHTSDECESERHIYTDEEVQKELAWVDEENDKNLYYTRVYDFKVKG